MEGLKSGFSSLGLGSVASFLSIGGAITGTVAAIKGASDATIKYAGEVRDLASVSGATAEEASRLLQVLDDYEISAQEVTAATRFLTKNGFEPTIDTLATLSDQYLAINDAQERNKFILDNLGRGGLQWVNVLKQGGDALRSQSAAVNENLVLTDKQIQETERYRLALDNLGDTIQGWKVAAVTGYLDTVDAQEYATQALKRYMEQNHITTMGDQQRLRLLHQYSEGYQNSIAGSTKWTERLEYEKKIQDELIVTEDERKASLDAFGASMDNLSQLISGELGPAQEDYNAKIADYQQQLSEARTAEEKMGITDKINEETEAYNKRATAIIFNIQQQAIMAAVQSGQISDAGAAAQAVSDLAYSYGLVDEKTKAVTDSTAAAISQFAATGNLEVFSQQLRNIEQTSQEAAPSIKNTGDIIYHTGERGSDAAEGMAAFGDATTHMGEQVSKDAVGPVSALKSAINGLPESGTSWDYAFNISVHGNVPKLPSRGNETGAGAGQANNAGNQENAGNFTSGLWKGGALGKGWTVVGDAAGGSWTPYTEVISPDGYVFDARTSRKMKESGMLGDTRNLYFGGEGQDLPSPIYHPPSTPKTKVTGGRAGSTKSTSSSNHTAEEAAASAVSGVSAQVAASIQTSVTTAVVAAQQAATSASTQNANLLLQINQNLQALVTKTASETAIAKAVQGQNSKYT